MARAEIQKVPVASGPIHAMAPPASPDTARAMNSRLVDAATLNDRDSAHLIPAANPQAIYVCSASHLVDAG